MGCVLPQGPRSDRLRPDIVPRARVASETVRVAKHHALRHHDESFRTTVYPFHSVAVKKPAGASFLIR
jgi:hypothetical protein